MRFHWQNLSEDDANCDDLDRDAPRERRLPLHGRLWLRLADEDAPERTLKLEWSIHRSGNPGVGVDLAHGELGAHVDLGVAALYLTYERLPDDLADALLAGVTARALRLSLHEGRLMWKLWADGYSWSSDVPRWRDGSFHPRDALFGAPVHSRRTLETASVDVPMPEGVYPAKVKLEEWTIRHPRWPFPMRGRSARIDVEGGIPMPGKGENSWDCEDDAVYGLSAPARSVGEIVGKLVEDVLDTRMKRGGPWSWPPDRKRGRAA